MITTSRLMPFLFLAAFAQPVAGFGQWLHYPTAGVPRKADGTPNLTARAPRLADGKPDFSGIGTQPDSFLATLREQVHPWRNRNRGVPARSGSRDRYDWWSTVSAMGCRSGEGSQSRPRCRRSSCEMPARQSATTMGHAPSGQGGTSPKLLVLLYEVNAMYRQIFVYGRPSLDNHQISQLLVAD
jgi:hypothetical protein